MEQRDAVAEARAEAADGLRRERDLRDEHDRAEPALERRRARLEVDLGLAAAGRAVEQEAAARLVDDPSDGGAPDRRVSASGRCLPCERLPLAWRRLLPARFRLTGATSASARAGVEP